MDNNTDIVSNRISKKNKLSKNTKAVIIILTVVAVVGVIIAVCAANKTALTSELTYAFMPKVIDTSDYDSNLDLVLYVEKNKDFDAKKDAKEPLKAFKYYYYDDNEEKVSLNYDDVVFEGTDNEMMACAQFYYEAAEGLSSFLRVVKIIAAVLAVLLVIGGLVLWFILWSKKYDKEKEAYNQKVNQSGKSKNNKKK